MQALIVCKRLGGVAAGDAEDQSTQTAWEQGDGADGLLLVTRVERRWRGFWCGQCVGDVMTRNLRVVDSQARTGDVIRARGSRGRYVTHVESPGPQPAEPAALHHSAAASQSSLGAVFGHSVLARWSHTERA
jgi:hypothetical protein